MPTPRKNLKKEKGKGKTLLTPAELRKKEALAQLKVDIAEYERLHPGSRPDSDENHPKRAYEARVAAKRAKQREANERFAEKKLEKENEKGEAPNTGWGGLTLELGIRLAKDPEFFVRTAFEWPEKCENCGTVHGEVLGSGMVKCVKCGYWVKNGPTGQQVAILKDMAAGSNHVSVKSGHGVGKTALLSWLVLWFISTHHGALILCTAPSASQLEDVLWAELSRWLERMKEPFRSQLEHSKNKLRHAKDPKSWYAAARTSRREQPDALQGRHATNMMFVIDEAPGVPEEIFEAAMGALSTPNAYAVMTGNPTRVSGTFHFSHTKGRDFWSCHTLSCLASELQGESYAKYVAAKYGENSDYYRIRVLGEFPLRESDTLIAYDLIDDAMNREEVKDEGVERVFGLDVARYGDDETVLAVRKGGTLEAGFSWQGKDTMQVCGLVAAQYHVWKPKQIFVDSIGIGAGVADRLRQMGMPAVDVVVSERPSSTSDARQYERLRDELWWKTKEWFERRTCSLNPKINREFLDDMVGQLATIKYSTTPTGKIRIESKSERKKRGLDSPDKADALMMTFLFGAELASPVYSFESAMLRPEVYMDGI